MDTAEGTCSCLHVAGGSGYVAIAAVLEYWVGASECWGGLGRGFRENHNPQEREWDALKTDTGGCTGETCMAGSEGTGLPE